MFHSGPDTVTKSPSLPPEELLRHASCKRARIPSRYQAVSLAVALLICLGACVQPSLLPPATLPTAPAQETRLSDVEELTDALAADYGLDQVAGHGVTAKQLNTQDQQPLYAAISHGFTPDDADFLHKVSLHRLGPDGWSELSRVELECVAYIDESSLQQVQLGPTDIWLIVQGGVGAHGGCLELLRWDGTSLAIVISAFSSSPDTGSVTDLNGDGQLDLLLDNSDRYIFCYACGVRLYWAQIFYWDGQALVEVTPTTLPADRSPELRALNDRAVQLAEASLFPDALDQIEQALALAPQDPIVAWNAAWIRHHLEVGRQEAATSPFPLLNHVFAGDWESALDELWSIGPSTFLSESPFPEASAAHGFERIVGEMLAQYADTALAQQPDRAAIRLLGAWGRFLVNRYDPSVPTGFQIAALLAEDDARYREIATAFAGIARTAPAEPTPLPPPDVQTLIDALALEYGVSQDPDRHVAAQRVEGEEEPRFMAFTYGLPPASESFLHRLAVHVPRQEGWFELGSVELPCVNYLDASSLQQVRISPEDLWLVVKGGAGAHGSCLELLHWDGYSLDFLISSFSSIPDAGSVTDLNGDGQPDLLLDNSDPYIFCYACGMQLYKARFFRWDGQALVEAAPRSLPEDHPADLRALNDVALRMAEASLYAEALQKIGEAQMLAPENSTLLWNAAWILHHLEVSRQIALFSPYPLLAHIFAGEWESSFDELWATGLPTFASDSPISDSSAAAGFEQNVGLLLTQYAGYALAFQPDRAAVHALDAWGRYLQDQTDKEVLTGFRRAAQLAPQDSRFGEIADAVRERLE